MNALITLLPIPAAIFLAALLLRDARALTRLAAALMAVQVLIAIGVLGRYASRGDVIVAWGFRIDAVSAFFLILTSLVVAASLLHAVFFFEAEARGPHPPSAFVVRAVYAFLMLFTLSMYGVVASDNLGFLWICMEASTLLSAPLVYYHRSPRALEATWKYLIICSVGIAFAFFGTAILYGVSQRVPGLGDGTLSLAALGAHAASLTGPLVRLAFVFLLVGYGTKAGLFPLHSWLPDAHSEAPAPVSAILSGALLNCSLVALWRLTTLMARAGQGAFVQATLLPMAVATVLAASLFLLKQRDLKRFWAYSSMDNVGLMAVAIALGSGTAFGLQALNHSVVKVALFLLAGNLLQESGTLRIARVRGLLTSYPAFAVLLALGTLAVAGTPPFGSFVAEWGILQLAVAGHHFVCVAQLLLGLAVAFVALSMHASSMLLGTVRSGAPTERFNRRLAVPGLLVTFVLALGFITPPAWLRVRGQGTVVHMRQPLPRDAQSCAPEGPLRRLDGLHVNLPQGAPTRP